MDLGSLQNNGGPTQTIALGTSSSAIDADIACIYVNVNPCTNPPSSSPSGPLACDQRGVPRPQGANCDIGAFKVQTQAPFAKFQTGVIVLLLDQFVAGESFTLGAGATFNPPAQAMTVTIVSPLSLTPPFEPVFGRCP